jgi:type I pantothenate kinase
LRAGRPALLGLTGSVAAGKTTFAESLSRRLTDRRVEIVSADGFLLPNQTLTERGLLARKGFPESYDLPRLTRFLDDVRAGRPTLAPRYSHATYDPLPDVFDQAVERPDLLIVEGVNALQPEFRGFYDIALYLDASEENLFSWYAARLSKIREEVREDPTAYLHRLALLSDDEFHERIARVWEETNLRNLREHIAPTRSFADWIVEKGASHELVAVRKP